MDAEIRMICALIICFRTRDLQMAEGAPSLWPGPPTSGNSTPLPPNIPESPTDSFPDLITDEGATSTTGNSPNRSRAGTLPSRYNPSTISTNLSASAFGSKLSRTSPTQTPFKTLPNAIGTGRDPSKSAAGSSTAMDTILRLRSGSLGVGRQGPSSISGGPLSPFGSGIFAQNWAGRNRASTLHSVSNAPGPSDPSSPTQSAFSREGPGEGDVKTLDYLGLAETPKIHPAILSQGMGNIGMSSAQAPIASRSALNALENASRFRSYSVNATEKYAAEEENYDDGDYSNQYSTAMSGAMTPAQAAILAADLQYQIAQHNLEVQAFANQAASRPRAKTSSLAQHNPSESIRNYLASPSRIADSFVPADLRIPGAREMELQGLPEALRAMQLNGLGSQSVAYQPMGGVSENIYGPATRSIWLGNVPASTTNTSLSSFFSSFGPIESARVLTQKGCGFVNFQNIQDAMNARALMNGKELFPGQGPVRIGYAKAPSSGASGRTPDYGLISPADPEVNRAEPRFGPQSNGLTGVHQSSDSYPLARDASSALSPLIVPQLQDIVGSILEMVGEFGATEEEQKMASQMIDSTLSNAAYQPEILNIEEPSHNRIYDAPKLRDIRKRIDNGSCSHAEIEEIARGMLDEISELASDYIGNTVVQKLFEHCSQPTKELMLHEIAPDLAKIGIHKNGTWAAQKIIEVCQTPIQMQMIVDALRPYTVALFSDQFGNYVIQCCLRFGAPYNNFIFEAMLSQLWSIAQGRFGARAMRACLESHKANKNQQRLLASAIALYSPQLASNLNATLLLTWYLDTWSHPRRRQILTSAMSPHLVRLCTDKVAYLTVLKVVNQKNEPAAREALLKDLFFSAENRVLEQILLDQSCGPTLVFKVLTTPFVDENLRAQIIPMVRTVLQKIQAQPTQGYKRLMDEIGMSTRAASQHREQHFASSAHRSSSRDQPRTTNSYGYGNGSMAQPPLDRTLSGNYLTSSSRSQYSPNGPNNNPRNHDQMSLNSVLHQQSGPAQGHAPGNPQQALHYQQALLAQAAQGLAMYSPSGYPNDTSTPPDVGAPSGPRTGRVTLGNGSGYGTPLSSPPPNSGGPSPYGPPPSRSQQFSPHSPYGAGGPGPGQMQGFPKSSIGRGGVGPLQDHHRLPPGPALPSHPLMARGRMPLPQRTQSSQYI